MKVIKVDIHGSIQIIVEENNVLVSCFHYEEDTIVINSPTKRLFACSFYAKNIAKYYPEYRDLALLAYGLNQLSQPEIYSLPGDIYTPTLSFWEGLKVLDKM